jgi:flagellar protein FlgJ
MAGPIAPLSPSTANVPERLRQQAQDLEGVFLNTLTKEMFSGVNTRGTFGGGFAEETWRGMQSEQFASAMAASGGVGLADQLVGELLKLQASSTGDSQ